MPSLAHARRVRVRRRRQSKFNALLIRAQTASSQARLDDSQRRFELHNHTTTQTHCTVHTCAF